MSYATNALKGVLANSGMRSRTAQRMGCPLSACQSVPALRSAEKRNLENSRSFGARSTEVTEGKCSDMKWPVAPEALRLKSYVGPFSMLVFQPNCSMRAKGNDR